MGKKQTANKLPNEITLTDNDRFILISLDEKDVITLQMNKFSELETLDLLQQCKMNVLDDIKKIFGR